MSNGMWNQEAKAGAFAYLFFSCSRKITDQSRSQQGMGKYQLRYFMALVWLLLLILGCGESNRGNLARLTDDIVRLTYWPSSNQQEIDLAEELVKKWNDAHSNIQVKMQPIPASQSSEEVLLAAIAGGTTPDVCSNIWPGAMSEFTQAGGLVRLDHFADFDSVMLERVPKDLLETFRSPDGHFYQIPWKTNPIMMVYNIEIFKRAGIDHPPRTYSEYLDDARKITRDINGDGQIDQWMGYRDIRPIWWQRLFDYYPFYIAASGGKTLIHGSQVIFENRYSDEVFRFFEDCFMKGYFPITTFQGDAFLGRKLATQFTGPWIISYIEKNKVGEFNYDFAPIPVPNGFIGQVYTYGDFKNIAIFSTTRHPRESWEFARYLISVENDLRLLELCSQIPIRKDLLTNPLFAGYFKNNPKMLRFAEQALFTRDVDAAPDLKEIFDAISQEFEACAVYGAKSPSAATHDAAKRASVIIQWNL